MFSTMHRSNTNMLSQQSNENDNSRLDIIADVASAVSLPNDAKPDTTYLSQLSTLTFPDTLQGLDEYNPACTIYKETYNKQEMEFLLKKFKDSDVTTHIFVKTAQGTPHGWEHLLRRYLFVKLMKPILMKFADKNESKISFHWTLLLLACLASPSSLLSFCMRVTLLSASSISS